MKRRVGEAPSEADVLKAVKQFLEARGFRVFRRNTGAVRASYTSTRTGKTSQRFVRFSEPGMADLYGWYASWVLRDSENADGLYGRHVEVEIKAPGKQPTFAQRQWLGLAKSRGCIAFWADSVDMAEAKLKEWGL